MNSCYCTPFTRLGGETTANLPPTMRSRHSLTILAALSSALNTCISASCKGRPGECTAGGEGETGAEGAKLEAPLTEEKEELEQQLQAASHPRSP